MCDALTKKRQFCGRRANITVRTPQGEFSVCGHHLTETYTPKGLKVVERHTPPPPGSGASMAYWLQRNPVEGFRAVLAGGVYLA